VADDLSGVPVRFSAVSFSLSGHPVLRDISFSLRQGEILVLLGPSGCGKTSLLRLIAGLEKPDAGEMLIFGQDGALLKPGERGIAFAFQNYSLFPDKSIRANLEFPLKMKKISVSGRGSRLEALYRFLGSLFRKRAGERPEKFSMGERQRVSVGRALALSRPIVLLDEPLSEVDRLSKSGFIRKFREIAERDSSGVVYVTNVQEEALAVADRVLILDRGERVACGEPLELYRDPCSLRVALALGSPSINTVLATGLKEVTVVDGKDCFTSVPQEERDSYLLAVRPEDIVFDPEGPLEGVVELVEKLSPVRGFVHLSNPQGWVLIVADGDFPQEGVDFRFRIRRGFFFSKVDGRRLLAAQS